MQAPSAAPAAPGMGAGSLCRMSCASCVKLLFRNGGRPTAHSYRTHPRDHRSDAVECVAPSAKSSGAMYTGVPRLACAGG